MGTMVNASPTVRIVRLIARLHPEWWDVIDKHGPPYGAVAVADVRSTDRGLASALNPQPLPPRVAVQRALRQTVNGIAEAAMGAREAGRDYHEILQEAGDDLCPPPPHRKLPWPRRWPGPWPPGDPIPVDLDFITPAVQAEAGLAFQAYAEGIADEKLRASFGELADRLFDTAIRNAGST